jgi:hypothetical protein
MQRKLFFPTNVAEALAHVHALLLAAGGDLEQACDAGNPEVYSKDYYESVKDAVLDAHLLVTWIKDNIKGELK